MSSMRLNSPAEKRRVFIAAGDSFVGRNLGLAFKVNYLVWFGRGPRHAGPRNILARNMCVPQLTDAPPHALSRKDMMF